MDPLHAVLLAMLIGLAAGYALARPFFLEQAEVDALRQLAMPEALPENPRRNPAWTHEFALLRRHIADAEAEDTPRVELPGGEPSGDVPPIHLHAAMSRINFAKAFVSGAAHPGLHWRQNPAFPDHNQVVVRVRANQAYLDGVETRRVGEGWTLSHLMPEHIDLEWTLTNRREQFGG